MRSEILTVKLTVNIYFLSTKFIERVKSRWRNVKMVFQSFDISRLSFKEESAAIKDVDTG